MLIMADIYKQWFVAAIVCAMVLGVSSQFEYTNMDNLDDIITLYQRVNPDNCHIMPKVFEIIQICFFFYDNPSFCDRGLLKD